MLDYESSDMQRAWVGPSAEDVGFVAYDVPHLRRKKSENSEYMVYSSESEFKIVEAETVTMALEKSDIESPIRVVPANRRIDDVVLIETLEFVEAVAEAPVADAKESGEKSTDEVAEKPDQESAEAAPEDATPAE